jgi:hypothetical protein
MDVRKDTRARRIPTLLALHWPVSIAPVNACKAVEAKKCRGNLETAQTVRAVSTIQPARTAIWRPIVLVYAFHCTILRTAELYLGKDAPMALPVHSMRTLLAGS